MQPKKLAPLGFVIGGILFMVAAVIPLLVGRPLNVAFFCVGISFVMIALALAKTIK